MTNASAERAPDAAAPATSAGYPAAMRLESLDLLRGLCALAVAVFHFNSWGGLRLPAAFDGFLAVCGTYGVSIFFVLSGYSLAHAYDARFRHSVSTNDLLRYAQRRLGRLIPLFSAIVFASIAGKVLSGKEIPDIYTIAGNLSLLFGFVDATRTPVVGGWSIGVEVVFYVLFPLVLIARRHALIVLAMAVFLAAWIDSSLSRFASLEQGWILYVTPANHFLFFVSGAYAKLFVNTSGTRRRFEGLPTVVAILILMILLSRGAEELAVVTGGRRLILTALAITLVVAVAQIRLSGPIAVLGSLMGGASYPLYLVHPLLFFVAIRFLPAGTFVFTLLLTGAIVIAVLIDAIIDKPLQRRLKASGW